MVVGSFCVLWCQAAGPEDMGAESERERLRTTVQKMSLAVSEDVAETEASRHCVKPLRPQNPKSPKNSAYPKVFLFRFGCPWRVARD
jgi:hypothetical protein